LPFTYFFMVSALSMFTTVVVGLPNESVVRIRYGYTVPEPVLMLTTLKEPRFSGSPGEPWEQPTAMIATPASVSAKRVEPMREQLDRENGLTFMGCKSATSPLRR
jgi:hypothetical protein